MKKIIYYFSGTGNSMRAAERIAMFLGGCEIVNMRADPDDYPAEDADLIGFCFPVYHWIMPEAAQAFVDRLKINPHAYIFAVSTPGLINGSSFENLAALLRKKGAALSYARILYSVANLVLVYPPFPAPKLTVPKAERELTEIAREIAMGRRNSFPTAGALTKKLFPSVMPKFIETLHDQDRNFFVNEDCISCGLCAKVCPRHNITLTGGRPVFLHNCACCMACISWCPKHAVKYRLPEELSGTGPSWLHLFRMPDGRMPYHNPHITAADLCRESLRYD